MDQSLAVIKVDSFDEALDVANQTEYGLTGSVYSETRENIQRAKVEFQVGNLYFNRKSTAAVVLQHPFGGFNMSRNRCEDWYSRLSDKLHEP